MLLAHLKTIFSFRFYHRLAFASARQMVAFGLYLFMLSVIVFYFFSTGYIHRNLPLVLKNFPQVTFEKGVLTQPQQEVSVSIPQSDLKLVFDASLKTPPSADEMIKNNMLGLVSGNTLYVPSARGLEQRKLPSNFSFVTSQENLAKQKDSLAAALGVVAMFTSLFAIPLVLFFGFCTAAATGLFFKLVRRSFLPRAAVFKWAFFMLGPLSVLWYVRLWVNIPLFSFAQVILCIIYMQQIFNTLPEEK